MNTLTVVSFEVFTKNILVGTLDGEPLEIKKRAFDAWLKEHDNRLSYECVYHDSPPRSSGKMSLEEYYNQGDEVIIKDLQDYLTQNC